MNWHIILISTTYFAIFHIEINQATKNPCLEKQISGGQRIKTLIGLSVRSNYYSESGSPGPVCVHYKKCRSAVKIAAKILSSSNNEEKETLSSEFKTLRCGNFFNEKTVCCNQDQIQIPLTSKCFICYDEEQL